MFRLAAPLLVSALANDETSLMQGLKPQQMNQKEDKSKAISNLLQSATQMLKNGATSDVVDFAEATLEEIRGVVIPAIENAHETDQHLVDNTHAMFDAAIQELSAGIVRIRSQEEVVSEASTAHKSCRAQEELDCRSKQECDYDLWRIWRRFKDEESTMRELEDEISGHFCLEGSNGTLWSFRATSVTLFPPWKVQKPIVEQWEVDYGVKVPDCRNADTVLDEQTAECDAAQLKLEADTCTLGNMVVEVRNTFAVSWNDAFEIYQRIMDEVHCLEIDRWKEFRSLTSIQCLLTRTKEYNGRPCDETSEITQVMTECEETQMFSDIDHLRITYPEVPAYPWVPYVPPVPCTAGYIAQEYADLWEPPQPAFHSPSGHSPLTTDGNSHCNQRPDCYGCVLPAEVPQCGIDWTITIVDYPTPEHECHEGTRQQMTEGVFDSFGDGHFDSFESLE